MALMEVMT